MLPAVRLRRVWAILIGMSVLAVTVGVVTIMIHDRSAHAEVSLGELMRKCLLLENYWALKSTQDTTSSIPNDGSAICFGYLLAFRGLQGAVIGTVCASTQSCRRTLRFCIAEQTPDERAAGPAASTTLADLLRLLFLADPGSAVRTSLRT